MLTDAQRDELRPPVRTAQIIVAALVLGVLNFAAVAVFIVTTQKQGAQNQAFITYVALARRCAVVAVVIVPAVMIGPLRRSFAGGREGRPSVPPQAFQTLLIIRAAILEGAIFFCLVGYLLEGQTIVLVAAGILLVLLMAQFPTMSRMTAWIENELLVAEQIRQLQ